MLYGPIPPHPRRRNQSTNVATTTGPAAHEVHAHIRASGHHAGQLPRVLQADPVAGVP